MYILSLPCLDITLMYETYSHLIKIAIKISA